MNTIDKFRGEYKFLSNFWVHNVYLEGRVYPSVEHAYQAAKTLHSEERSVIAQCASPSKAKKLGRQVTLRPDWEVVKLSIMHNLVRCKFQSEGLAGKLLATGEDVLVEGNWWGDTFWGSATERVKIT